MSPAFLKNLMIACCLLLSSCSLNNLNLSEGTKSFQVQDYRKAFIYLKPEAEKGQMDAQYAVGYMYYYGQGVVEDKKHALYWIERAAKSGQPEAKEALKLLADKTPIGSVPIS